jgi:glycine/D-amino acid oxidase-like deaminating enzyme/nitrite reductase/ring-hydroxylating ferredoxin subunit
MPSPFRSRAVSRRARPPKLPSASRSLWIDTRRYPRFAPLKGDLKVDVAVVGGGITGLTAATLLKAAGKSVAVLEAQRVAEGVTGYTTAHLTEVIDASFGTLISHFGDDQARLALDATRASLDRIAAFVREGGIECGFRRVPGFYFAEGEAGVEDVREEYEAIRHLGMRTTLTEEVPLPFPVAAAIRFEDQARFHVREYLLPLLKGIPGGGSQVFEDTRVVDVEDGTPCQVKTESGVVTARDVVLATHVPLNKFFLQTKVAHYRSYVLACRVDDEVADGLFWDNEDPYHYLRLQEADGDTLLVVGGEDHKTGQEEDTDARFRALLDYALARFKVRSVLYRWSAQVVEPVDGLPFLGRNSLSAHVYVGTGYSGTGMTFGTLAAMIASDLILERDNPWARLFDATRVKPLAAAREFVSENVDFPAHLVGDRLKKADADSFREVARGEGKIVEAGGKKVAVYRDETGAVHAVDPVCTHMKCLVEFNTAEKSWDCPCHGSRFDVEGKVLNGPAVKDLGARPGNREMDS